MRCQDADHYAAIEQFADAEIPPDLRCRGEVAYRPLIKDGGPLHFCSNCWWHRAEPLLRSMRVEYRLVGEDEALVADIMWR